MSIESIEPNELMIQGLNVLSEKFGIVGAERFISILMSEPADYTKWRQEHLPDMSVEEFNRQAVEFCDNREKKSVA